MVGNDRSEFRISALIVIICREMHFEMLWHSTLDHELKSAGRAFVLDPFPTNRYSGCPMWRAKIIAIVLTLVGPGLLIAGFSEANKQKKIEKEGVDTVAIITNSKDRRGRKGRHTYTLVLNVPQASKSHSVDVSKSLYEKAAIGTPLPIRQIPSQPDTFAIIGESDDSLFMEIGGGVMFLVGIGMIWYTMIRKKA